MKLGKQNEGNEGDTEGDEENELSMDSLIEGFKSMNIKVEGVVGDRIIQRILTMLRERKIQDGVTYVMQYAEQFLPDMTILNQDFVDELEGSIMEIEEDKESDAAGDTDIDPDDDDDEEDDCNNQLMAAGPAGLWSHAKSF